MRKVELKSAGVKRACVLTPAEHISRTTRLPVFTQGSSLGSDTAFLALEPSPHLVGGVGMGWPSPPLAGWPKLRSIGEPSPPNLETG